MFRLRYFPLSSLFLEPLGTTYIMHPGAGAVNIKIAFPTGNIWFKNMNLDDRVCGRGVHKTSLRIGVLARPGYAGDNRYTHQQNDHMKEPFRRTNKGSRIRQTRHLSQIPDESFRRRLVGSATSWKGLSNAL
jgi:hypothetical protein